MSQFEVKPVLQALLLADNVYDDKRTGKKIVAGIFSCLHFIPKERMKQEIRERGGQLPSLPAYHAGSPFLYASLTDMREGEHELDGRYVDLHDDRVIFQVKITIKVKDPLQVAEIIVPLPSLPASKPGVFAFELLWKDEPLGSYRVNVKEHGAIDNGE